MCQCPKMCQNVPFVCEVRSRLKDTKKAINVDLTTLMTISAL